MPLLADIEYDTLALRRKYDSVFFADTIPPCLEMGAIITAYYDHSNQDGWPPDYYYYSVPSPEDLTNDDSLSVLLSYSCSAAMFQRDHPHYDTMPNNPYDTCFAECFLYNQNGGAVAFYGGTGITWINLYTTEPLQRMLRSQQWILGKMLVNTTRNSPNHCFCLLGDPALDLGDYTAYPELPDLVIRPPGLDFSTPGYPYYNSGDIISIGVLVWNIGADTAFDVDVDFDIVKPVADTIYSDALVIDTLLPRDTAYVVSNWNTGSTHPYFYGIIGDCKLYVNVDPDSEISESWEGNNSSFVERKIALYPYQSGWPKKVTSGYSQPAIGNLDGSGSVEIVFIVNDSIYVFDKDGNTKLGWPKYLKKASNLVLADLDCMGNLEIIVTSEESLTVFDYQGSTVSGWPQSPPNPDSNLFYGSPSVGYITGADKRQVILCIRGKYPIDSGGSGPIPISGIYEMGLMVYDYDGDSLYYLSHDSMYCDNLCSKGISISDVNRDGDEEMVTSYEYHHFVTPGDSFVDSCFTDIFNKNGHVRTLIHGSRHSIPAMVDLDYPFADGVAEIIIGDMNDTIRAYKERTQTTLWKTNTGGAINSSPAVGNINPSYQPAEIAFGNDAEKIWAIRGDNGEQWDPYPIETDVVRTSPALAKLGGKFDWYPDIIVAANDWIVYGLECDGDTITPFPLPVFGSPSSPVIGDIDGDCKSETILATGDGYLHVWRNVNSYVTPYALEWPQYHHDYQRTGVYNWVGGVGGGDASPPKFSTSTIISFSLTRTVSIQITVYDVDGNVVKNLVSQVLPKGSYNPVWYGKNNSYALLPDGIYIIEFKVDNERKFIPVEIDRQ
ncbi:MAG: C25 family cysteine peptidase [bacterium]